MLSHTSSRSVCTSQVSETVCTQCPVSTGGGTRRVRIVRGEGRGVSDLEGGKGVEVVGPYAPEPAARRGVEGVGFGIRVLAQVRVWDSILGFGFGILFGIRVWDSDSG